MNNTNTNTNIDIKNLSIIELITNINTIGCEKNKSEFIQNYSYYKEVINIIDNILIENNDNKNDYDNKNINELFEILETYHDKISCPENINPIDLQKMMLLVKIIEYKLENDKINITEIK